MAIFRALVRFNRVGAAPSKASLRGLSGCNLLAFCMDLRQLASMQLLKLRMPVSALRASIGEHFAWAVSIWGFNMGIIVAFLHDCGVVAVVRERLNRWSTVFRAFGPRCYSRLGDMLSGPGASLGLRLAMANFSSVRVKGGGGLCWGERSEGVFGWQRLMAALASRFSRLSSWEKLRRPIRE